MVKQEPAKSASAFEALTKLLEGWFDKPLAQLPAKTRARVQRELHGDFWDALNPVQRRIHAQEWDYNNDPALEERRSIAWDESVVDWLYWRQVPTLTGQEFCILRHVHDPRNFEKDRGSIPGGKGKTLGERIGDDVRIIQRDKRVQDCGQLTFAEWVAWSDGQKWDLPLFMRHAARAGSSQRPDIRQNLELQSKAENLAKGLRERLNRIPTRREVAKELAMTLGMHAATLERVIRKTW